MNPDRKIEQEPLPQRILVRWVLWTILLAVASLAATFAAYFFQFSGGLSSDQSVWAQFGDFVGGTVNPILGFLTIIALALTLILQSKQLSISSKELKLSRVELELTRQELRRSAEAQELSEKALRAQASAAERSARLAATNFLLEHYKGEIKKMHGVAYPASDPRLIMLDEIKRREGVLTGMLDTLFTDISGEKNHG